jgi:hypothetical protein
VAAGLVGWVGMCQAIGNGDALWGRPFGGGSGVDPLIVVFFIDDQSLFFE